jgi:hypothetical protein
MPVAGCQLPELAKETFQNNLRYIIYINLFKIENREL